MKFFKTVRPLGSFGSGITSQVITKIKSKTNHLGLQGNDQRVNGIFIYQYTLGNSGTRNFSSGSAEFTTVFSIPQMTASAYMHVWELKFFISGTPLDDVGDVSIQAYINSAGTVLDYAGFTLRNLPNVTNQMVTNTCYLVVVPSKTVGSTAVTITATAKQPVSPGVLTISLASAKLTGINENHFTSWPGAVITPYSSTSEVPFENRIFLLPADSPDMYVAPSNDSPHYAVDGFFTQPGPSQQHVIRTGMSYNYDQLYALGQPQHLITHKPTVYYSAFPYHNYGHAALVQSEVYGTQLSGGTVLNKAAWANRITLRNADSADSYLGIKKQKNLLYHLESPIGIATTFGFSSLANTVVNGLNCAFVNHGDLTPDVWELGNIEVTAPGSFDEVPRVSVFNYMEKSSIVQISVEVGDLITPVKSTACVMAVQPYFNYSASTMKSANPADGADYDSTNNILTAIQPYSFYGAEATKYPIPAINGNIIDPSTNDDIAKSLLTFNPYCSFALYTQAFSSSTTGSWTTDSPPNTGYTSLLNFSPSPNEVSPFKEVDQDSTSSAIQVFYEDNKELIKEGVFQLGRVGVQYTRTFFPGNVEANLALDVIEQLGGAALRNQGQNVQRRAVAVTGWDNYAHLFASIADVDNDAENLRAQAAYTPNPDVAFPS